MNMRKTLASALVLVAVPFALAGAEIGKPAPDFALKDLDGKEHKLADLKGKVVVLEWINHECPVSNKYQDNKVIAETRAKFKDKPVVWIGINSSSFAEEKKAEIKDWTATKKIDYPILLDAAGTVGKSYDAKTTPHIFVLDTTGKVAYMGSIDDSSGRNYVTEAVTSLLDGKEVAMKTTKPMGCTIKYKK